MLRLFAIHVPISFQALFGAASGRRWNIVGAPSMRVRVARIYAIDALIERLELRGIPQMWCPAPAANNKKERKELVARALRRLSPVDSTRSEEVVVVEGIGTGNAFAVQR